MGRSKAQAPARGRKRGRRRPDEDGVALPGGEEPSDVDRLIHEPMRLGIMSVLAVNKSLSFNDLKSVLGATDGNLSVHARRLEEAGYLSCTKGYEGRVPKTEFKLTAQGRKAFTRYLDHMEALIKATREG